MLSYKPGNIFTRRTASIAEVKTSIDKFNNLNITDSTLRRKDIVNTIADDIVFDALVGSKSGYITKKKYDLVLQKWSEDTSLRYFSINLLKAQIFVFICQCIYLSIQVSGLLLVLKIINDLS